MSGGDQRLLGRWGEAQAARWLREHGYQVLEANWRCRFGEIDLIAKKGSYLCFVEVKLRKDAGFAQAVQSEPFLSRIHFARIRGVPSDFL